MLVMANRNTQKKVTDRHPARREFAIGDGNECPHPDSDLTYLGHQGPNSFWQCQRCEAVIIRIPEDTPQQMNEIPSKEEL